VAIARGLHADNVPTTTGRATWRSSTVSVVLRNPLYVGKVRHEDELFDGQHEAIIDAETWQRVSDLLAARGPKKGRGRPPKGSHLFRGGMLRCGECGDAMVPRTKTKPYWQEYYCCSGHIQLGDEYCTQGCVSRADVDAAVYAYFERVGLDVEATRAQVAESRDRKIAEVQTLMLDAEREAQLATERLDRVRRDYQDGKLDADDWREQREQLTEELDGAKREAARLADQEREIDSWGDVCDVEAETLRKLASIRKAIAGEVKDADGIEAVRAALTRLFERFVLDVDGDEATMTPVARWSQSWTTDEQLRPIVRPTPLDLAANNQHQGSGCLK
jgi:Recombinase/Recombinase zinc beta ribbon domain